jgi:hypothetical protein
MNKEILIDKKKKRVAINQLRNAEDKAGAKREKKAPGEEERTIRKIVYTQKEKKKKERKSQKME